MKLNPWTFLLQVINFVVLAYVLHRLLYRPLREAIERRRQAVRQTQAEAEKAREQAEVERGKILDEAESAARRRQEDARRSLERDREEMLQTLTGEVVTHALNLTERLLRESVDSTLQAQLVKRLIETLDSMPADEREQLRRDWRTEEQTCLEAAAKPDGETLERLAETVAGVAGRELALNVRLNPALIGGVRLQIGGHIWDASIAGQLEEARLRPQEVSTHV